MIYSGGIAYGTPFSTTKRIMKWYHHRDEINCNTYGSKLHDKDDFRFFLSVYNLLVILSVCPNRKR